MISDILLAFVPIFFAMDPVGILPIFAALTHGLTPKEKKLIIVQSLATAAGVSVGFIFFGKAIFHFLGITIGDFMIAGGAILFCLSMMDLVQSGKYKRRSVQELGAVPIGTPLVVGPAVLTITLMMIDIHGLVPTLIAVLVNIGIVGVVFINSERLIQLLGQSGSRALSKVMAVLLAAIGVMMIRRGVGEIFALFKG